MGKSKPNVGIYRDLSLDRAWWGRGICGSQHCSLGSPLSWPQTWTDRSGLAFPWPSPHLRGCCGEACYMPLEHRMGSSASLAPLLGKLRVNWTSKDHGAERSILACLASLHLSDFGACVLDLNVWFWDEVIQAEPPPGVRLYEVCRESSSLPFGCVT